MEAIVVLLLILWLLGYFVINVGQVAHLLLVVVVVVVAIRLIQGRKVIE